MKSIFLLITLSLTALNSQAADTWTMKMNMCEQQRYFSGYQAACMETEMARMIMDVRKGESIKAVILGCKHVASDPYSGDRNAKVMKNCFQKAASFMDQNPELSFSVNKQAQLLSQLCGTANETGSVSKSYDTAARINNCYTYGGQDQSNSTILSQQITEANYQCVVTVLSTPSNASRWNKAEIQLTAISNCVHQKIVQLGQSK